MTELKKRHFPLPGQRILRSVAAVLLCFLVYLLRGSRGIPFYSVIATLQCMQPYTGSMRKVGRNRIAGTLIGAFWGLMVLLLERRILRGGIPDEPVHLLLVGLFTGLVLYFTVLARVTEVSYFSAVVFLCITVNHIGDENPYLFVLNRVLDTTIGVVVAELVNRLQMPRRRNTDVLFVSGINDTIFDTGKTLSPYARVELNRLIEDGAQFTVSTLQTPQVARELMAGVDMRLPIIALDGAALYDLGKSEYLRTVCLDEAAARRMTELLDEAGLNYFTNSVDGHLLIVHSGRLGEGALRALYESKRSSPYRTYFPHRKQGHENIVYYTVLDEAEKVDALYKALQAPGWSGVVRAVYDEMKRTERESCLKIYAAAATREAMLKELTTLLHPRQVVTFGSIPGKYDVLIQRTDKDRMVKELKRRFEPVDFRCWKNILRLH